MTSLQIVPFGVKMSVDLYENFKNICKGFSSSCYCKQFFYFGTRSLYYCTQKKFVLNKQNCFVDIHKNELKSNKF